MPPHRDRARAVLSLAGAWRLRIRALCVGPGLGLKQRAPCDTAYFRLVPSMCPGQLAAPTPAPITSLFSAGMWLVAGNLCASEIRALLCTCSGARGSEGLAVTKTLPCSQATSDIITAAKLDSEKDEALEYVASAELRLHPLYGDVTFDDLCHFKCCSFRKLGCMPRLGAVLTEREYSPVRSDHAARQAERHSKRKVGVFLPLAKQPGLRLVSRLAVFKAVMSRYECDGVLRGCPRKAGTPHNPFATDANATKSITGSRRPCHSLGAPLRSGCGARTSSSNETRVPMQCLFSWTSSP